jgi:hypothetical protein
MKDFSRRSSVFLVLGAALAILAGKGIGPFAVVLSVILLLGLALRVEWSVAMLLAFWVLVSAPLLTALGESQAGRDRLAILFLTFITVGLVRLVVDSRGASEHSVIDQAPDGPSPNGQVTSD